MQVTFRGQLKENIVLAADSSPQLAIQIARVWLETYGQEPMSAAEYSASEGFIVYFSDTNDSVEGVKFNVTDQDTINEILSMFGFDSHKQVTVSETAHTWIKTPDELLVGA